MADPWEQGDGGRVLGVVDSSNADDLGFDVESLNVVADEVFAVQLGRALVFWPMKLRRQVTIATPEGNLMQISPRDDH